MITLIGLVLTREHHLVGYIVYKDNTEHLAL